MLSTLRPCEVPRGSDATQNSRACLSQKIGGITERLGRLAYPLPVLAWGVCFSAFSGIILGLH